MSYGLIYIIPFASFKNEVCVIEIEKEDYAGETTELIPAESPFSVDIEDDDFMYVATRFSTGKICVVGSDYLRHLYSTAYQQYRVTFKRNNVVTWCGFIKPELYTQDYTSELFELEIECTSTMSVLEFIPYKQIEEGEMRLVTLWELLTRAITLSKGRYNSIIFPYVYSRNSSIYDPNSGNVLTEMRINEQNFFDEDDKPMTWKEILEEICKLLNWTCIDWRGELYFIDIDHQGAYRRYSTNLKIYESFSQPSVLNVQKIGFSGSDHSLDFVPGYNKVTVMTSNYHVHEESDMKDFSELTFAVNPPDVTENNHVTHKILYLPGEYNTYQYLQNGSDVIPITSEYVKEHKSDANTFLGALPAEVCRYELKEDGTPSINNYNYDEVIHVRTQNTEIIKGQPNPFKKMLESPVFSLKFPLATYYDGAFVISGNFTISNKLTMPYNGTFATNVNSWNINARLRVGNQYFNGTEFITKESTFLLPLVKEGGEWFSVKDTKTLSMPYNGANGYLIVIPRLMVGDVEMTIYGSGLATENIIDGVIPYTYGYFMKNFKLGYIDKDGTGESNGGNSDNSDRYYENVLNEDYINELDEIEFKISSYNNDGACYSKVMIGDKYLEDNLYSVIEEKLIRPEEQLIRRIINRYSDTHIKLTQEIQEVPELTPITRLSDDFMVGKVFINTGGTIDYKQGKFRCIMIEV